MKDPDALFRFRLEHLGEPCDNECGRFGQHVHHKVFRSQGGGDVPENLAWLCHICHSAEHGIRVVEGNRCRDCGAPWSECECGP